MSGYELNIDGLVSPCHNYAGLAAGNLASAQHSGQIASPRAAALQGLEKMWQLHQLGIPQAVMPPPLRPHLPLLRSLGFDGHDTAVLRSAGQHAPELLAAAYSASSMWAANSATVSASADSQNRVVHFTPANLIGNLHRSIEAQENGHALGLIFNADKHFQHHSALPASRAFGDEGAANHTRLCPDHDQPGLTILTYGYTKAGTTKAPKHFPARHSLEATEAIIRSHQLNPDDCFCVQQHPDSIDLGVFHNDVIAVGHRNLLLIHEQAWCDQPQQLQRLQQRWQHRYPDIPLYIEEISTQALSVASAVSSYLFNSQLLTLTDGTMLLLAPEEVQRQPASRDVVDNLLAADNPLQQVLYMDLRQSMNNGGGPACLRLRVPLSTTELAAMHSGVKMSATLYQQLRHWIEQHYRDQLAPADLQDPLLMQEIQHALEALAPILKLPTLYTAR